MLWTALDLLTALEGVHKAGYIHRDVKPANFALYQGPGARSMATGGDWRIIDFGIARRFVDDDGNPLPKREAFGEFRGSTTYASIHAHLKQDLGERHATLLLSHCSSAFSLWHLLLQLVVSLIDRRASCLTILISYT